MTHRFLIVAVVALALCAIAMFPPFLLLLARVRRGVQTSVRPRFISHEKPSPATYAESVAVSA